MTLQEWQKLGLWKAAAKMTAANPIFAEMVRVLEDEDPSQHTAAGVGSLVTDFAYAYGREMEHKRVLKLIEAMLQPPPEAAPEPEPTFADTNNESAES